MKLLISFASIFAMLMLAGCSKLTKENYDKVAVGMDYDKVIGHIGKPDKCTETLGMKSCVWQSGDKKAVIGFIGDSVTVFSSENLK